VLYLDPEREISNPLVKWADRVRTKLNPAAIETLRPLLAAQPYVAEVRVWRGEAVDVDLDVFRMHLKDHISDAHHTPSFSGPGRSISKACLPHSRIYSTAKLFQPG